MGIWRVKGVRAMLTKGYTYPVCRKEEGWSLILRCERTKYLKYLYCYKMFTSIDLEIGIRKIVSNKIKDIWPKTGL
jgi:hypothetical protein